MNWKKNAHVIVGLLAVGITLLVLATVFALTPKHPQSRPPQPWTKAAIKATYVGSQLMEVDKAHAQLSLSYDLDNNTDLDYRFDDGAGVVIMSRLLSDGSLNQQEVVRLSYPVFLPARQRARIAIEVTKPFEWPPFDDPSYLDNLRDFVKQRLVNIGEFVLFDENHRQRFELPSGWEELQDVSQVHDQWMPAA